MFSEFNQAFVNLLLQFLALLVLVVAVSQVSKDPMHRHCRLVSVAVILQLISIIAFMFPSMSTLGAIGIGSSLQTQLYMHHFIGLAVIVLSIFVKLEVDGRIKHIINPFKLMKIILVLWVLVFLGGVGLYLKLWEGISII